MTGRVPQVAFRTLGCKVNRVESDAVATSLLSRGFGVGVGESTPVVVVNTCTVTAEADAKARKCIRQALNSPSTSFVVVTGCLATLEGDALRALGDRVIVEPDKSRVAELVAKLIGTSQHVASCESVVSRADGGFRTRAAIKIEDGCDHFCAYCIVPHARGVPRSTPLRDVVSEAEAYVDAGIAEIVLTGINIGRYRDGEADLSAVVEAVAATGVQRLRLSSIEPQDLDDRLLATLSTTPSVCPHLHVPLQSGSDAVLAAMRRGYTSAQYHDCVDAARATVPDLVLTTDVIAGFPGESPDDHARGLAFIERIGFGKLHVFRYSARSGTPAAAMEQLPGEVRAARAAELRLAGDRLRAQHVESRVGSPVEVLVEQVKEGFAEGTTREYLRVRIPSEGWSPGDLVTVSLTRDIVSWAGGPLTPVEEF